MTLTKVLSQDGDYDQNHREQAQDKYPSDCEIGTGRGEVKSSCASLYRKERRECEEQKIAGLLPEADEEERRDRGYCGNVAEQEKVEPGMGDWGEGNLTHWRSQIRPTSSSEMEMAAEARR